MMKTVEINSKNMKILVCCHKSCELPPDPNGILLPIHVGAALSDIDLNMQRDDQLNEQPCDNISDKNKSYCELTALYWAWKNIKNLYPDLEYIGLNHYRRYFDFDNNFLLNDSISLDSTDIINYKLDIDNISNFLSRYNIITGKKGNFPYSLCIHYCIHHNSDDFRTLSRIIRDSYPEYYESFLRTTLYNNKNSFFNMFIMKWDDFNSYCEWLFSILKECEKCIDISTYNPIQQRIWGYMAERLTNVWIEHKKNENNYKIKYLHIYLFNKKKKYNFVRLMIKQIKNEISFKFSVPLSKRKRKLLIKSDNIDAILP